MLTAATAALLMLAFPAGAFAALENPSFENDLTGWTATVVSPPDANGATTSRPGDCSVAQRDVCVITGNDTFNVATDTGEQSISIPPLDGNKMVRLGGPFHDSGESQVEGEKYRIEQTFTVDPADPVLHLNYFLATFDYSGFDELTLRVTVTDPAGAVVAERETGSFGDGTSFKTSGWRGAAMDLTGYEGQQLHLRIEAGGTQDSLYGFWAYVDAGTAPTPPQPTVQVPTTPSGQPIVLSTQVDGETGLTYFTIPNSQASEFPGGCVPFTLNVPINPGTGTISDVHLLVDSADAGLMEDPEGDNTWTKTVDICDNSTLTVQYTATEGGTSQVFTVLLGGVALIDPQGVVYDQLLYNQAIAAGQTPEQARSTAAISGASVRLQRFDGTSDFDNVLSADPGIFPNVNPEITEANGKFQWDVSAGRYRVVVTKSGYPVTTSPEVDIPPPVLDLHVAMCPVGADCSVPSGGQPQPPQPEPEAGKAARIVTLDANKNKVKKGKKVELGGQVDAPQNEAGCEANQTVALQRSQSEQGPFQTFAQVTTNAAGNFTADVKVKKTLVYRAQLPESAACEDEASNSEKVKAKPKK